MNALHRLLSIAALAAAAAAPALAETRMIDGSQLVATLNHDDSTIIEPDATLHGQVRLSADDLSCVQVTGSGAVTVSTGGCSDSLGHLRIEVPYASAVTLVQSGDGTVTVGSTAGPLTANVGGSGDLTAGRVGTLVLNVTGSGDTTVEAASGPGCARVQRQRIGPHPRRRRPPAQLARAGPAIWSSARSMPGQPTSSSSRPATR
jgi:hypothetical protein